MVACGWRRGAAEPGRGVSVGLNAVGNIYNNLIVNCYHGLEIFPDADTTNTKYDNNYFYSSVDKFTDVTVTPSIQIDIRANFYPATGVGKPAPHDLISNAITNLNPMFKSFDGTVSTPNGVTTANDFHLLTGSPALGKGNATYNNDIGAYTSDGQGNKH
ncbi:hypothetical protein FACS1894140_5740 [Spirochaetia bacterium]|nr:hypothetical protein FACS1894140_5740 [Spirochaetia bacterium]